MKKLLFVLSIGAAGLIVAGLIALQTGFARWAFLAGQFYTVGEIAIWNNQL